MNQEKYHNLIIKVLNQISGEYLKKSIPAEINSPLKARNYLNAILTRNNLNLSSGVYKEMDLILQHEMDNKLITRSQNIPIHAKYPVSLWKGDITTLEIDAIVNAANAKALGCFMPNHMCIDNVIHKKAGPRLRRECSHIMQKRKLPTSGLIMTEGYNLPAKNIIHMVGPIYNSNNQNNGKLLTQCYINCLDACKKMNLKSIAFCSISTGEYKFPKLDACMIALKTVKNWLDKNDKIHVVFCVYNDDDYAIYRRFFVDVMNGKN